MAAREVDVVPLISGGGRRAHGAAMPGKLLSLKQRWRGRKSCHEVARCGNFPS